MDAKGNTNPQVLVMNSPQAEPMAMPRFTPVNTSLLAQALADDQSSVDSAFVDAPSAEAPSPVTFLVETPSDGSAPVEAPSAETTLVGSSPVSSPAKRKVEDEDNSDNESISKKPKTDSSATNGGQRKKTKASRAIARSYRECEEYDKKLIDMYEAGHTWPQIRAEWQKITGERTATSTLPNRYQRLMNNFTVIPDTDKVKLIEAKQKIEKEFEAEKWSKIAQEMKTKGSCVYKGDVLERQHKKMMLEAEELPPIGSSAKKNTRAAAETVAADDETIAVDELS